MKILFLDIDGVLNSQRFFDGRKWDEHVEQLIKVSAPTDISFWGNMIDPAAAQLLEEFLAEWPDSSLPGIVISSSWREVHPLGRLYAIFHDASFWRIAECIIDRTDVGGARECVIADWALRFGHEISAWAVVDDSPLPSLKDRHVRTTWADGLQPVHIEKLRELLR